MRTIENLEMSLLPMEHLRNLSVLDVKCLRSVVECRVVMFSVVGRQPCKFIIIIMFEKFAIFQVPVDTSVRSADYLLYEDKGGARRFDRIYDTQFINSGMNSFDMTYTLSSYSIKTQLELSNPLRHFNFPYF